MNEPESLTQVDRTRVLCKGRKLSYFAGCDYFRLASHPAIIEAVGEGLRKYGLNVAASRVTTGNHALYRELENALARYFDADAALVVPCGYASNSVAAQALRGAFTHAVIDAKAHMSLRDASLMLGCPVLEFKSRDPEDLRRVLARAGKNIKPILLTDSVFTYESEVAPVAEYLKILGSRGMILLDDAHGAGILGEKGRGVLELAGVSRRRVIQTMTLSKAFGVYGGAILGSSELRGKMFSGSRIFTGSTPLPLPLVYAGLRAVELVAKDKSLRRRLAGNVTRVKTALRAAGYPVALTPVPVAAVTPTSSAHEAILRKRLLARGVFPSFINYPGGPSETYLRIVISSEHTSEQLDNLLGALDFLAERGSRPHIGRADD
jgi:7-keto-8-aminopelargonate synthetase-like enzyme